MTKFINNKYILFGVIGILLLSIAIVFICNSNYTYADYESDILNNPQSFVNFNQLINTQLDYTNSEVDSRDFFVENITINDTIFQSQVIGLPGVFSVIVQSSSNLSGQLIMKHSGSSRDLWVYSQNNFNVISGHSYLIRFNAVSIDSSTIGGLVVKDFIFIDLTSMFGSSNIPTLEQCNEIFITDYYAYNTGTAVSFSGLNGYTQGVQDVYNALGIDVVQFSAFSSAYINQSINNSNAFVNKYIDYEVADFPLIQFRGYLSIPLSSICRAGTQINIDVNGYPDMGGAGGDSLWVGIWYNDSFIPVGKLSGYLNNDDVITSFVLPFDTDTIILSVSDSDDYFHFYDVGKWIGDLKISNAKLDIDVVIDSAIASARYELEEYYNDYYGQYGTGYRNIYDAGFNAGINSNAEDYLGTVYTFPQFLGALFDVPVRVITSLLDFDVFGFNLKNFAFSIITIALIFAIIRLILQKTGDDK